MIGVCRGHEDVVHRCAREALSITLLLKNNLDSFHSAEIQISNLKCFRIRDNI